LIDYRRQAEGSPLSFGAARDHLFVRQSSRKITAPGVHRALRLSAELKHVASLPYYVLLSCQRGIAFINFLSVCKVNSDVGAGLKVPQPPRLLERLCCDVKLKEKLYDEIVISLSGNLIG